MVDSLLDAKKGRTVTGRLGARLARTVVLGSLVVAAAIYWLAESYDVDKGMLLEYLRTSLAFVLFFVLAGILGGVLIWLIRLLRRH
ncbi:MAG: hypothetical protein PVF57_02535 [Pseudomonadales bacterium]|jgi:hypothetical protein